MTNLTYMLDTKPVDHIVAEANCRLNGGHLVSYQSGAEQRDVESYFMSTGTQLAEVAMQRTAMSPALFAARAALVYQLLKTPFAAVPCRLPGASLPWRLLDWPQHQQL